MNSKIISVFTIATALLFVPLSLLHAEIFQTGNELLKNKKTSDYISSPSMHKTMYQFGVSLDVKYGLPVCQSKYNIKPVNIIVLSPVDFPDDKENPTKGTWIVRYKMERCGESKIYNVVFFANSKGEEPTARAYYPGSSIASSLLIKDAMLSAFPMAVLQSDFKDCKDVMVYDMRVTEQIHDVVDENKKHRKAWSETWTFQVCRQLVDVVVNFINDPKTGGTFFLYLENW